MVTSCEICGNSLNFSKYNNQVFLFKITYSYFSNDTVGLDIVFL